MSLNQSDITVLIVSVQAGRDQLARAVATRTNQIAADQADIAAAQTAVTIAAANRQADLDNLIASNQAQNDAQLAAEQATINADNQDIADQQATLALDQQGLAQLDSALAGLNALLVAAPPAPIVPPVIVPSPVTPIVSPVEPTSFPGASSPSTSPMGGTPIPAVEHDNINATGLGEGAPLVPATAPTYPTAITPTEPSTDFPY